MWTVQQLPNQLITSTKVSLFYGSTTSGYATARQSHHHCCHTQKLTSPFPTVKAILDAVLQQNQYKDILVAVPRQSYLWPPLKLSSTRLPAEQSYPWPGVPHKLSLPLQTDKAILSPPSAKDTLVPLPAKAIFSSPSQSYARPHWSYPRRCFHIKIS